MELLSQLVDRLITSFLPAAVHNHNFFINEIAVDLLVEHNNEWVASIISGMIATAVSNTRDNCIRFSAKKYGYVLVLEIRESGRINNFPIHADLQQIQRLAEKIGGCLFINTQNEKRSECLSAFLIFLLPPEAGKIWKVV